MLRKTDHRIARAWVAVPVLGLTVLVAACSQSTSPTMPTPAEQEAINAGVEAADAGNQISVTWDCDGTMIPVRFMEDAALVDLPDGTSVTLPIARSGSGARYTNGTVTYWEHQGTARIETPTQSWEDCQRASA